MTAPEKNAFEEVELNNDLEKTKTIQADHSSNSDTSPPLQTTQTTMNKEIWLACFALCLAYTTAYQQNSCTSAILKHIDEELGPTTYYNWMLTAYTICVSVSLPISGGLSDIFGRRNFVMGGCCVSLVGTAIAIGAQNIPMMIAAMGLKGIGSGSQQLALAAVAELVPNKHRGHAQAVLDIVTLPWAVFGSLTGNAMVKHYKLSFRINFIIGAILNVLSISTIFLWYHPPGAKRIAGKSSFQRVKELDWVGICLMAVGVVMFLMGIAFGGAEFPWRSGGTISPIVIGICALIALGIWEWKIAAHPFFAHELFIGQSRKFSLFLAITFVGGMSLYAAAAFWTQQVQGMWTRDPIKIGLSSIPGGIGGATGGFFGGILLGKHRFFSARLMLIYGVSTKLLADGIFTTITPNDFKLAMGMGFLAMLGVGFMLVALIVCTQLTCKDEHIGLATLVLGSVRAMGGSVAVTIFTSIIQNTLKEDGPKRVVKAVRVPRAQYAALIKLVIGGKDKLAAKLPGVSPEAVKATRDALKWTWGLAFKRMYYSVIAFSALALVAAFFVGDVTHNMTDSVAVTLQNDPKAKEKRMYTEPV